MKSILAALALIAAVLFCGWTIFGEIPATEAPQPADPIVSGFALVVGGLALLAAVVGVAMALIRGGQSSGDVDANMSYVMGLDKEINDVLWELKGTPRNGARSQASGPSPERAMYLNTKLINLEDKERQFWRTHKYEKPNGGHIVNK